MKTKISLLAVTTISMALMACGPGFKASSPSATDNLKMSMVGLWQTDCKNQQVGSNRVNMLVEQDNSIKIALLAYAGQNCTGNMSGKTLSDQKYDILSAGKRTQGVVKSALNPDATAEGDLQMSQLSIVVTGNTMTVKCVAQNMKSGGKIVPDQNCPAAPIETFTRVQQ